MKKIFWFSRHDMTEPQVADLQRIFGEVEIKKVSATISNAKEIIDMATDFDVLAVVLPPAILADLVNPRNNDKPVIRAIANRVPTGNKIINPSNNNEEDEFRFEHAGWEKLIRVEIITERL